MFHCSMEIIKRNWNWKVSFFFLPAIKPNLLVEQQKKQNEHKVLHKRKLIGLLLYAGSSSRVVGDRQ